MAPRRKLILMSLVGSSMLGGCSTPKDNTRASSSLDSNISSSLNQESSSLSNKSSSTSVNLVEVTSISLNYNENIVYEYKLGDTLNLENVTIKVTYSDGSEKDVQVSEDMIKLFDFENNIVTMNDEGYTYVCISYEGKETSYLIEVINENAPIDKKDPLVTFSYEAGTTFYLEGEKPSVTILPENIEYEITYSSDESGYNSSEFPTSSGVYSMVVRVKGNQEYNDLTTWRWFKLVGNKQAPSITFNYSGGTTFYIGSEERPTVSVSEGADYVITYSSDSSGYNSTEFPTVPGTYSLVVTVHENETFSSGKAWLWFKLAENKEG